MTKVVVYNTNCENQFPRIEQVQKQFLLWVMERATKIRKTTLLMNRYGRSKETESILLLAFDLITVRMESPELSSLFSINNMSDAVQHLHTRLEWLETVLKRGETEWNILSGRGVFQPGFLFFIFKFTNLITTLRCFK